MMDRPDELLGTEAVPVDERRTSMNDDPTIPLDSGRTDTASAPVATRDAEETGDGLLGDGERTSFRDRWEQVQGHFVDDPRHAVENADDLVSTVMGRLQDVFAAERDRLEGMWARGEDVGTEDLRVALQRYREFFNRLLAA